MSERPDPPHVGPLARAAAYGALGLAVWFVAFGLVTVLNNRAVAEASALYAAKRYAEAEATLNPAIVRDPGNAALRVLRAKARCEAGRHALAAEDARAAIKSAGWWFALLGEGGADQKALMRGHLVLAEVRWHEVRGLPAGAELRTARLAEAHREVEQAAVLDASCEHKDLKAELPAR